MFNVMIFGPAVQSSPGGDFLQLPTALSTVNANASTVSSVVQTATAGTRILLDDTQGTYDNLTIQNNNGSRSNPVVLCPADKNVPIIFRGKTKFEGSGYLQIFGVTFDGSLGTPDAVVDMFGQNKLLAHCKLNPYGIGITADQSSNDNIRYHRCHFTSPILTTGSIGKASFKAGSSPDANNDTGVFIDWCLFDGPCFQREHVSVKCADLIMQDCQFNRNGDSLVRDIAVRHGRRALFQRIRGEDHDIFTNGTDHIIRNCIVREVGFAKGDVDGDSTLAGSSSVYLSAKRCVAQQITGNLHIGAVPWNDPRFTVVPDGCTYSDISGTVIDDGTNSGVAAAIPSEAVPTILAADVGVLSYRSNVTGAP